MANRYWVVSGTGNWNHTSNWSTTSGGASGASKPTDNDNAIFDSNSGTGHVTLTGTGNAECADFDASAAGALVFDGTQGLQVHGNFKLASGQSFIKSSSISPRGTGSLVFNSNGVQLTNTTTLNFANGTGSAYTLQNNVDLANGKINFQAVTFDAAGYNITCESVSLGPGTKSITMGSGTWTLFGTLTIWDMSNNSTGLTLNASTAKIEILDKGTTRKTFKGGGQTYYDLQIDGPAGAGGYTEIDDSNSFNSIILQPGSLIRFEASKTQTLTVAPNWTGTNSGLINISTTTSGTAATIACASGVASCDYLTLKDSTASGSTPFYAGTHSTNVSGNTNWTFTAPP